MSVYYHEFIHQLFKSKYGLATKDYFIFLEKNVKVDQQQKFYSGFKNCQGENFGTFFSYPATASDRLG